MIADQERFNRTITSFDAANREDPNRELLDGRDYAKELLYAERMSAMLNRYVADASEPLQLAALGDSARELSDDQGRILSVAHAAQGFPC